MAVIHVPKPDVRRAMNPERPVNALLKAQVQHLHEAERRLPLRHQTDIYVNAIKTEGEAAEYIRQVTEAIYEAHKAAAKKRARPPIKPKRGIAIAAAAGKVPVRKETRISGQKKGAVKRGRKS